MQKVYCEAEAVPAMNQEDLHAAVIEVCKLSQHTEAWFFDRLVFIHWIGAGEHVSTYCKPVLLVTPSQLLQSLHRGELPAL